MSIHSERLDRRAALKAGAGALAGLLLPRGLRKSYQQEFPEAARLGRIAVGKMDLKATPSVDSATVGSVYQDNVVPLLHSAVGWHPYRTNQRWFETPDGYLWAGQVQPVRNEPNEPVDSLPETSLGPGFWAEVSVPYVDLTLINPPARAPWLKNQLETNMPPRFFWSQIVWVDDIRQDENGQIYYRLNQRYGYGDLFWAAAEAFRPLTLEDMEPIRSEVEDKRIIVDVAQQTMSCYEGEREVYFCQVSTGARFNASGERVDTWGTPLGSHNIWRKAVSLPLSGGSAAFGWDLPAVGWISLFVGSGVAIHSTFWHNNYGEPSSRGCVNAAPEDAHWVFRWTNPVVPYDPGDMTVGIPGGTEIRVVE
ncbi:MAG: L,D-transpeptidase [Anaerolineales bacterium]